jgi:hypothetical protein
LPLEGGLAPFITIPTEIGKRKRFSTTLNKFSGYPLFYQSPEKKSFEVQLGELWTVESL